MMLDITPHDALPGETPAEYFARRGLRPMTLNHLIQVLEKIRQKHGGDLPLIMADGEPVVRAHVVNAGATEGPGESAVVISDL